MRELFQDALKVTNNNIILTIPLILFIKILDIYSVYSVMDSAPKILIATITVLFMFGAFCAAWFYMIREAIQLSKREFILDEDRANAALGLFKLMPEGIGKFFLSFVGVYVIFAIIQLIATPIVFFLGVKLIGVLDAASMQSLQEMAMDPAIAGNAGVALFIDKLSPEQIVFLGKWSLLFMAVTSVVMYLLVLWIPEIVFKTPNPMKALYFSLIKLFKDFVSTLRLFFSLWFMGLGLLFINSFAIINPFAYIIMSIIMFYFVVYMVVLIFLYYDKKYMVENE